MVQSCAAIGCSNTNRKLKTKSLKEGVTFHRFPLKQPDILKQWMHNIRRKGFNPTVCSFLCSEHFDEEDFVYQPFTGMRMIKKDAVPSKFIFTKECSKRKRTSYEFGASVQVPGTDVEILKQVSVSTQTELSMEDLANIIKSSVDNGDLVRKLQSEQMENKFSILFLDNVQLRDLTGFDLKSFDGIFIFFKLEEALENKTKKSSLNKKNQLFLTLLKLRHNLTTRVLAILFGIPVSTVYFFFNRCISVLYHKAREFDIWPSVEQVKAHMPPIFYERFPSCRVIIDATEFYIQKPSNPSSQQASFSTYKNFNTLKVLIGIAPSGAISFISDLWLGGISDKELTLRSGLIDKLDKGDTVLADRGFTSLESEFRKHDVTLQTPTFLKDKIQFPLGERSSNKNLSHHRVHVERAIGAIKCFKILDGVIPLATRNINEIYFVCAFLCNFTNTPLISSEMMVKS